MLVDVFFTKEYRAYFFGDLRYACLKSKDIGRPFIDSYSTISLFLLILYTLVEALFLAFYCNRLRNIKKHYGVDQYFIATGVCWFSTRALLILVIAPQVFNTLWDTFVYIVLVIVLNNGIFFFQTFMPLWKVKQGAYQPVVKPGQYFQLLDDFPQVLISKSAVYHFLRFLERENSDKTVYLNILTLILKYDLIAVKQFHDYTDQEKQDLRAIALQIKQKYLLLEEESNMSSFQNQNHILQDILTKFQNLDAHLNDQLFSDLRGYCESQLQPVYYTKFKEDKEFKLMKKSLLAEEIFEKIAIPRLTH